MKMNNDGLIAEAAGVATLLICIMTFVTFMVTTGAWEPSFWESDLEGATIIGSDGSWGEDIVVTYTDGTVESVKSITNSYWGAMSIENDGSNAISSLEYCINAKIPIADVFNTWDYQCDISITQNGLVFYQTIYTTSVPVDIEADEWTRIITVPLNIQVISDNWDDGTYLVSFENTGDIEGVAVPSGLSLNIIVSDNVVSFMI